MKKLIGSAAAVLALLGGGVGQQARGDTTPIQHVVLLLQENHSFDDVLGKMCAEQGRCDGVTQGKLSNGTTIPLAQAPDIVPNEGHTVEKQVVAMNKGLMNGFNLNGSCSKSTGYSCYSQYDPTQIPNLAALATTFALSDRTFEFRTTPSWVGHMVFASATTDGFQGNNPGVYVPGLPKGPGWGCDSNHETKWSPDGGTTYQLVPSCIPNQLGQGPAVPSPVQYVPTIFDRLDGAGLSWKIYGGTGRKGKPGGHTGYNWTICPTFYECLGSSQFKNWTASTKVITDATAGTLPAYSIVTPTGANSQHNTDSMSVGDNWIGSVVSAIENGPDWSSTAIFITYDDCGCFYDHVNPLQFDPSWGIRVPIVMVSPYARPGFVDSTPATFMGILAYVEHTFGLQSLVSGADGAAYDFSGAFDYSQVPLSGIKMVKRAVPPAELRYIARHQPPGNDPT